MFGLSSLASQIIGALVMSALIFAGGAYAGYRWESGAAATANAQWTLARASNQQLSNGLDQCNQSIAALKTTSDQWQAAAQRADKKASEAQSAAQEQARKILAVTAGRNVFVTALKVATGEATSK